MRYLCRRLTMSPPGGLHFGIERLYILSNLKGGINPINLVLIIINSLLIIIILKLQRIYSVSNEILIMERIEKNNVVRLRIIKEGVYRIKNNIKVYIISLGPYIIDFKPVTCKTKDEKSISVSINLLIYFDFDKEKYPPDLFHAWRREGLLIEWNQAQEYDYKESIKQEMKRIISSCIDNTLNSITTNWTTQSINQNIQKYATEINQNLKESKITHNLHIDLKDITITKIK